MSAYTQTWGAGAFLMIHCALAHSGVLRPLSEALPGGARAFDLPGHGRSPAWDPSSDYSETSVRWARAAMGGRAGPVIGHSYGATVALRLAVEAPELITELYLIEPVFFAAIRLHDRPAYVAYLARFEPVQAAFVQNDLARMAELFTAMWDGAPLAELPPRFQKQVTRQMPLIAAQFDGIDRDNGGVFAPGKLSRMDCPVTLIRGSEAEPSIPAIHDVLLSLIPGARAHVIEGAGHMLPITHPREVAALIRP
ncbi:MAG: alpha/beta hydrolase [Pseudomonadota bacterium]